MKFLPSVVIALLICSSAWCSTMVETTVFDRGEGGYYGFRIPAVVQAQDGTLLAFAEGRKNSLSDFGNIDLVVKRSYDGGLSWSALQIISSNGLNEAGNPSPVVDQATGKVILLFNKDHQTSWMTTSANSGVTWSGPVDITSQTKLATWDGHHFGPGHGIQLLRGENAGRIVIPSNHNLLGQNLEPDGREISLIYSDDSGSTWNVGGTLINTTAGIGPNESIVTELINGTLYVNARSQGGYSRHRLIGYSDDAGFVIYRSGRILTTAWLIHKYKARLSVTRQSTWETVRTVSCFLIPRRRTPARGCLSVALLTNHTPGTKAR